MKSPETGQNALNEKLFLPWNLEGEANVEYLEFLRRVNERFINREEYVAISGYGSQFKGYSNEVSDFDCIVIGFDAMVTTEDKISAEIKEVAKEFGKKGSVPFLLSENYFTINLNPEKNIRNQRYNGAIWPLAYPLIGKKDKIKHLRKLAHLKHKAMENFDPATAKENFLEAVKSVIFWELGVSVEIDPVTMKIIAGEDNFPRDTSKKIKERGFSKDQLLEVAANRTNLWGARIMHLLESTDEFAE